MPRLLARALAIEPRVLLLDEPFGSLDAKVRKELRRWLRNLHTEIHVTSVFVTHDQEEALEVADRVVVMDRGRIEQTGTPQDIYERPGTPFVHEFIGELIVVPVEIEGGGLRFAGESVGLDAQGQRARSRRACSCALMRWRSLRRRTRRFGERCGGCTASARGAGSRSRLQPARP